MIFLHGIRYHDIQAILTFMYSGEVNVNQEDLPTFLAAAEELRIRGLSDKNNMEAAAADSEDGGPEMRMISSPSTSPKPGGRSRMADISRSSTPKSNHHRAKSPNSMQSSLTPSTSLLKRPNSNSLSAEKMAKRSLVITPDISTEFGDNSSSQDEMPEYGYGGYESNLLADDEQPGQGKYVNTRYYN